MSTFFSMKVLVLNKVLESSSSERITDILKKTDFLRNVNFKVYIKGLIELTYIIETILL